MCNIRNSEQERTYNLNGTYHQYPPNYLTCNCFTLYKLDDKNQQFGSHVYY